MDKYEQLQQQIDALRALVTQDVYSNLKIYRTPIEYKKGLSIEGNVIFGTDTGTKIGTSASQKISVYGATPIVQQAAITAPTGGATIDSQSRTAIGTIITVLKNFGITA